MDNKKGIIEKCEELQAELDTIIKTSGLLNILGNSPDLDEEDCFDINRVLSKERKKPIHGKSRRIGQPKNYKLIPETYCYRKTKTAKLSKIFSFIF